MSADAPPTRLRQLALDYAAGRLARGDYVRERSAFLDGLTGPDRDDAEPPGPGQALGEPPVAGVMPECGSPPGG